MQYKENEQMKNYLSRFDKILYEMSCKMLNPNIVNNITLNFIECMIPHHQAAIYMSQNLLQYTRYIPLENIARGIIEMQEKGIMQMKEIARTTIGYESHPMHVKTYMQKYFEITKNMLDKMKNSLRTPNINLDFTSEMIPHHEGAILMCNNLLKYRIDPRLVQVANTIIQEQTRGVIELKEIQKNIEK